MEKTLKYGIIGSGMMGGEHINNIHLLGNTQVVALGDPTQTSLDTAKAHVQSLWSAAPNTYLDYREMLNAENLDAVVIAAPNFLHHEILLEIFLHHPHLAVLAEKPLCTTFAHTKEVFELSKQHKAPLWVAMEYRYIPAVAKLVDDVKAGVVGNLKMLSIREHRFPFLEKIGDWNRFADKTGGTLVEKCCHFFDLMRLITDDEPLSVYASGGIDVNHLDETYDGKTPDIIDNAYVIVDFQSGKRAMLELCMFAEGSAYQEHIAAVGDAEKVEAYIPGVQRFWPGALENPESAPKPRYIRSSRTTKQPVENIIEADAAILNAGDHQGSTFYQHQGFKRAILGEQDVEVTMKDGLLAVVIGLAAEQSIMEKRVVRLDEYAL